jgi:hypothetical protein
LPNGDDDVVAAQVTMPPTSVQLQSAPAAPPKVIPAGKVSVTTAAEAMPGPAFVTLKV